jgi:predicted amino acid dehydrogenase
MIQNSADMAIQFGAQRLGLGAFTSIVTSGGSAVAGRGIPVTSGNTLTTVSAVTAIERVARRVGLDPADAHVAVIGASGAIGRLASLMLARRVGRLTLVGNARNAHALKFLRKVENDVVRVLEHEVETLGSGRLQKTVKRILPQEDGALDKSPAERFAEACNKNMLEVMLDSTTDLDRALEDADIVLVATNADIALVDATRLLPGTIVCDVARPQNVAEADLKGTGVLVFDGGLVQPPFPVNLGPFQNLPENLCWGCLGETMLLALEGESADYSVGRDLELAEADRIAAMARRHGFEPAEPQWYGRMLDTADFDRTIAGLTHRSKLAHINTR